MSVLLLKKDVQTFNGAGTQADPYVISTKADLKLLQTNVNNGTNYLGSYFVLGKDIDMEGEAFLSIGGITSVGLRYFGGFFDGRNFTIRNLAIMKSDVVQLNNEEYNGLFGYLYGATIENLNIENIRLNVSAKSGDDGAAGGANLVGKAEVMGSSPIISSKNKTRGSG